MFVLILFSVGATWYWLEIYYYGPKSQVKRLWKKVFKYTGQLRQLEESRKNVVPKGLLEEALEKRRERVGKLINAQLDYYYGEDEGEQEYVLENKWKGR